MLKGLITKEIDRSETKKELLSNFLQELDPLNKKIILRKINFSKHIHLHLLICLSYLNIISFYF